MTTESLPGRILTLAAVFIGGFALAAWCLPSTSQKPRITPQKTGVFLVLPTKDFLEQATLANLRGKLVRLVRRHGENTSEPCVITHQPARLQMANEQVFLEFGLDGLESLVLNINPTDLKQPEIVDSQSVIASSRKLCPSHPRITYGS
jgi:hypothetical protein